MIETVWPAIQIIAMNAFLFAGGVVNSVEALGIIEEEISKIPKDQAPEVSSASQRRDPLTLLSTVVILAIAASLVVGIALSCLNINHSPTVVVLVTFNSAFASLGILFKWVGAQFVISYLKSNRVSEASRRSGERS
jgi:hypothetical protein